MSSGNQVGDVLTFMAMLPLFSAHFDLALHGLNMELADRIFTANRD